LGGYANVPPAGEIWGVGVVGVVIEYTAMPIELLDKPVAVPKALIVSVELTEMAAVYRDELVVGVDPLVV
jgi:hypothetical protein